MAKKAYRGHASDDIQPPVSQELKPQRARKPLPGQMPLWIDGGPLNPPKRKKTKKGD